jgi:hypothetical protein
LKDNLPEVEKNEAELKEKNKELLNQFNLNPSQDDIFSLKEINRELENNLERYKKDWETKKMEFKD